MANKAELSGYKDFMNWDKTTKLLLMLATAFLTAAVFWQIWGKDIPWSKFPLGRLPGDIVIKRENSTFYFPIVTCLLISLILSLLMKIFRK